MLVTKAMSGQPMDPELLQSFAYAPLVFGLIMNPMDPSFLIALGDPWIARMRRGLESVGLIRMPPELIKQFLLPDDNPLAN